VCGTIVTSTMFRKQSHHAQMPINGHIKTPDQRTIIYNNTVTGALAVDGWAVTNKKL